MVRSDYMRRIEGELGAAKSALAEMREQLSIVTRERDELRLAFARYLVAAYRADPVGVAKACDEEIDPTGALLGFVRDAAAPVAPGRVEEPS